MDFQNFTWHRTKNRCFVQEKVFRQRMPFFTFCPKNMGWFETPGSCLTAVLLGLSSRGLGAFGSPTANRFSRSEGTSGGAKVGCGFKGLVPTSVIQGNLPLRRLVFGKPFFVVSQKWSFPATLPKPEKGFRESHRTPRSTFMVSCLWISIPQQVFDILRAHGDRRERSHGCRGNGCGGFVGCHGRGH